jgi:hypothetical protein
MVGRLIKTYAVGARCSPYTARLFVGVELKVTDEVARVVIEVGEVIGCRLL